MVSMMVIWLVDAKWFPPPAAANGSKLKGGEERETWWCVDGRRWSGPVQSIHFSETFASGGSLTAPEEEEMVGAAGGEGEEGGEWGED